MRHSVNDSPDVNQYIGNYFSEELQVNEHFSALNDTLTLSYGENKNIKLHSLQKDEFGNHDRTLFVFIRNDRNQIIGMNLSCDGNVQDIEFSKLNALN